MKIYKNIVSFRRQFGQWLDEKNHPPKINITAKEASVSYFCFAGEFGFEIVSWIPYLLFLKKKLGITLRTISRPGSNVFYYFSDEHHELESTDIDFIWGDPDKYKEIEKRFSGKRLVYPYGSKLTISKQEISVEGYKWENKDIHAVISERNYLKPSYSHVKDTLPFVTSRPIVVINNKYVLESGLKPINFYSRDDLVTFKNFLISRGYFVVYNRFIEKTAVDKFLPLRDKDIFIGENCFDMRKYYLKVKALEQRNRTQISLFNWAAFVLAVQGGNVYLPAVCGKDIFLLMRMGVYLDYQELSRLYKFNLEAFYEPRHLLSFLKNYLQPHHKKV